MTDGPVTGESAPRPRRGRRGTALLIALLSLLALAVLAAFLPVPYVKIAPGPTFNTIGEIDGRPLVEIGESTQYPTYPVTGNLNMTTIQEWGGPRGGLTVFQAVAAWLDQGDAVLPRELLYPDDETKADVEQRNAEMFSTSQSNAIAAALTYAEIPVEAQVTVTMVVEGTPAAGNLRAGDHVLTLDGVAVTDSQQIGEAIQSSPIGTTFAFGVERAGEAVTVSVTSADNSGDPGVADVGISLGPNFVGPMPIQFTLQDIGGPSAGLFFSLAIVDKLTPADLAAGRFIAGTGTISPDGSVGAIGGIRQKLAGAEAAGAELFLMPKVHCGEAAGYVPDGLKVVPVETLTDAIVAIEAWKAGSTVPACPA